MAKFNLRGKVIAFFQENHPKKEATNTEIARWIVKTYPDDCKQKIDDSKRINDENGLRNAIQIELTSHTCSYYKKHGHPHIYLKEGLESVKVNGRWGFRVRAATRVSTIPSKQKTSEKFAEDDMYDPLRIFLLQEYEIESMPIEHRNAKKTKRGGDMWLYPDLVGLEDLSREWDDKVIDCVKIHSDKMSKLWSFELKKAITPSNVREYFFQAVSNSSWANLGYLVACEIDNESLKELRILSNLHGIGFIKLDIEKYQNSQIIIPAQEKKEIDWSIVNRLLKNKDYQKYISLIKSLYKLDRDERKAKWSRT